MEGDREGMDFGRPTRTLFPTDDCDKLTFRTFLLSTYYGYSIDLSCRRVRSFGSDTEL